MYFLYRDYKINYQLEGSGTYLVLMHGWGVDLSTFNNLVERLKAYYTILTFDFLGFGDSSMPTSPLTLKDYVDVTRALIKELKISNPIILGHSFGGRVAIKYANLYDVKLLILFDSAGIKHFSIAKSFKIYRYKLLKRLYKITSKPRLEKLVNSSGSSDYQKCTPIMKKTMSNVIKVDLKKDIKKIKCNTLILWGYYDKATPYQDALYMNKYIKGSRLITFFKSGHFPYLDEEDKTVSAIISGGIKDGGIY